MTTSELDPVTLKFERYFVYSKYFARMTKYINRSIKVMNNFHENFHNYSLKFERPLYYLGLGCIIMSIGIEFQKVKNESTRKKTIFFVDILTWHAFASFIFPGIIISNSIRRFTSLLKKVIIRQKLLHALSIGFSVCWIPAVVSPIDNFTTFILNNTTRKFLF
jgi:hypothetical protein